MLILFFILYFWGIRTFIKKASYEQIISPLIWGLFAWVLIFGLWLFSGIRYSVIVSQEAITYIVLGLLLFSLGFKVGEKKKYRLKLKKSGNSIKQNTFFKGIDDFEIEKSDYFVCTIISASGLLICLVHFVFQADFQFGLRNSELSMTPLSSIGYYTTFLGSYLWFYSFIGHEKNGQHLTIQSYICFIVGCSNALLTGNRWSIFYVLFGTFLAYLYATKINRKTARNIWLKLVVILLILSLIIYLDYVIKARFGNNIPVSMYNNVFNATMDEKTLNLLSRTGGLGIFLTQALYYFSQEIPYFCNIFNNWYYPNAYGTVTFHYIARRFGFTSKLYYQALENVRFIDRQEGILTGVYQTIFGTMIVDFGRIPTLLLMFVMGFMMGCSRRRYLKYKSLRTECMQIVLCIATAFSIITFPLKEGWAFILYWSFLIPILHKVGVKLRKE